MRVQNGYTPASGSPVDYANPRTKRDSWPARVARPWLTFLVAFAIAIAGGAWAVASRASGDDVKQIERRVDVVESALKTQTEILKRVERNVNKLVEGKEP